LIASKPNSLASALRAAVQDDPVLVGEQVSPYLTDATEAQALSGTAEAVVLPSSTEAVAAAMTWCYEHGVPIVPRGGGTGYAGGCVPDGGVVLATDRLRAIRSFEPLLWRAELEAGIITRDLQRLARENGLYYPVDPGAAEQSQLGGNIATNAGGPHAFKYGVTGAWVMGLEAVIPPGEPIRVGGPIRKDVAGYDLRSLLVGSEGTLGVITSAHFRLIPAVERRLPVVAFYEELSAGCRAVTAAMASGIVPAAIEYLDAPVLQACGASFPERLPDRTELVVIAEADGSAAEAELGQAQLQEAMAPGALELHVPRSDRETAALWRWREGVGIAVDGLKGGKMSEDIAVPLDRLQEAIEGTVEIGTRHGVEAGSWGHAGDGNLHSTFMFDRCDPDQLGRAHAAAEDLFELATELGGTISGEHGIGVVKAGQLRRQWEQPAIELHRRTRELFDPAGLMNPGKKEP